MIGQSSPVVDRFEDGDGMVMESVKFAAGRNFIQVSRCTGDAFWRLHVDTDDKETTAAEHARFIEALTEAIKYTKEANRPRVHTAGDLAVTSEIRAYIADREWTYQDAATNFGLPLSRFGALMAGNAQWRLADLDAVGRATDQDADDNLMARLWVLYRSASRAR